MTLILIETCENTGNSKPERYTSRKATLLILEGPGASRRDSLGRCGCMAKVFTIPVPPKAGRRRRENAPDPRYVDGQRLLVEAMKYLAQADPVANRDAVALLSEHVRTRFRMSDSPLG
jgi:hypothetical protein